MRFSVERSNKFFVLEFTRQRDRFVVFEDTSRAELRRREFPVLKLAWTGVVSFNCTGQGFTVNR
jgi:hypothetical protein